MKPAKELVAERSKSTAYVFLALSLLGILIIIFSAIAFFWDLLREGLGVEVVLVIFAVGVAVALIAAVLFGRQLFLPYRLLEYDGKNLILYNGRVCAPFEIANVEGAKSCGKTGKITLFLKENGEKILLRGVKNYSQSYERLNWLITERKNTQTAEE